ncbi:hypothetical protein PINS_up019771 [Pythium insidiosum]|nr:hypothetical protein PINS_up000544 [Pythium insidiosum]GLE08524.1 hypothetical protein PINS_up019771 [Pythium insidiosum]
MRRRHSPASSPSSFHSPRGVQTFNFIDRRVPTSKRQQSSRPPLPALVRLVNTRDDETQRRREDNDQDDEAEANDNALSGDALLHLTLRDWAQRLDDPPLYVIMLLPGCVCGCIEFMSNSHCGEQVRRRQDSALVARAHATL